MHLLNDVELLARLVAFDSTSAKPNLPIADFLADYLATHGCRIWRSFDESGQKANLVARRGPETAGGLILSGHLDVVPALEPDWAGDPFRLAVTDDKLIGRGSVDMKGFVALAANLTAALKESELKKPLVLLFTHDEEVGSRGAQRFVKEWRNEFPLPGNCIVGEPTGLRVVRMHKGHLTARVRLQGRAAHSGYPHLGVNAIELAGPVIEALSRLAREWKEIRAETSEHFPECPHPVLNLGKISGGSALNVVPEACEIGFGVRLLPGQRSVDFLARIQSGLDNLPPETRDALTFEILNDNPPLLCDKRAPANVELARLLKQCATVGVSFASDAGPLQALGLNCVLFGPGDIADAHRANEFVTRGQFEAGKTWLEKIVRRFCCEM